MLPRVLEPEVMDSAEEARDYDAMDHSQVNRVFAADFLSFWSANAAPNLPLNALDVGTGTAQIPIELCTQSPSARVVGVDLAEHMLTVGSQNVNRAGMANRIELQRFDAKGLPFADQHFPAVISNSIIHHIPEPRLAIAEMVRVAAPGGVLFVRDLLRPARDEDVTRLVQTYAGDANAHGRAMFDASLRAALTLAEIRALVQRAEFDPASVQQTSDRHWTWAARVPAMA